LDLHLHSRFSKFQPLFCSREGLYANDINRPWIDGLGGPVTTIMLAVLCLVSMMSFLVMVKWGKSFRRRTSEKYLHYTAQRARQA
jgi:hypothetical protein